MRQARVSGLKSRLRISQSPVRLPRHTSNAAAKMTALGDQLPHSLTDEFAKEAAKQTQWAAFLRRNGLTGAPLDFAEVIGLIRQFVGPAIIVIDQWCPPVL